MVSIDYGLVVYKITGVTRDFFEFLHEEHDGLKDSWNMVCEWLHEFDIRYDYDMWTIAIPTYEEVMNDFFLKIEFWLSDK